MTLPTDKTKRKERPIARGVLDYFPDAIAEVARVSYVGNQQHNPGEEMHWAREKSMDHADCIARHLIDRGKADDDGMLHSAKAAWRALALLQLELEANQAKSDDPQESEISQTGVDRTHDASGPDAGAGDEEHGSQTQPADPSRCNSRPPCSRERDTIRNHLTSQGCRSEVADWLVAGVSYPADGPATKVAYLSGPMSGMPNLNFLAFDDARERLTALGYAVISPADVDRAAETASASAREFVYRDFWAIFELTGGRGCIAVLPGWEKSTGSAAEVMLGRWMGLPIINAWNGGDLLPADFHADDLTVAFRDYLAD